MIIINFYTVGIPLNAATAFGFHLSANSRVVAKIKCGGIDLENDDVQVSDLSQCSITIYTASSKTLAGVRCFEPGN